LSRDPFYPMIQRRIQCGVVSRAVGITGEKTRPDLRPDGGAHPRMKPVFKGSNSLHRHSAPEIPTEPPIFIPHVMNMPEPSFSEITLSQRGGRVRLHEMQPDQLELQVVIRRGRF